MTKDEALDLALEALESLARYENPETRVQVRNPKDNGPIVTMYPHKVATDAITAIKQARALDKKAENARELGLDYEPVQEPVAIVSGYYGGQCVIQPLNPARIFNSGTAFYTTPPAAQPAPTSGAAKMPCGAVVSNVYDAYEAGRKAAQPALVQEPLGYIASMAANDLRASIYRDVTVYGEDLEDTVAIYTTPPAAQRQWVGLTNEQREVIISSSMTPACVLIATEAKLKEKNSDR